MSLEIKLVKLHLAIATCLLVVSTACGQDSSKDASSVDTLAAVGLLHSVMLLRHAPEKPVARAPRLVGLAEFARRLAPDDPDINNTIAYLSLMRNKEKALTLAIRKSFLANGGAHALGLQWMASEMKGFQDSQSRAEFLNALIIDTKRPPELRAAAAVYLADILIGQGLRQKASEAFNTAVKLDPNLPAALNGQLTLSGKVSPVDRAKVLAIELRVNPHSLRQAAQLGEILDAAGLYTQAARFYDYAWEVNKRMGRGRKISLDFAVQHCNALLNAGRYEQATKIFGPISRKFTESVLLRVLLIEACNNSAQTQRAKIYAGEIEAIFAPKISGGNPEASAAAELAWLYLITGTDIQLALEYAKRAAQLEPNAPATVRALAAAQILSGKKSIVDLGRVGLQKIADKNVFAAAFLAEHYFKINREEDGKTLVLSGLAFSRSGQAARRLTALAKKHKITIPPTEGSEELQTLAESIPESLLTLGLEPEKSLSLKIIAPKHIDAGDGIVVQAELSSTYDGKLSTGMGGFIPATVSIDVTVKGRKNAQFKDVVRLLLPVGRYLARGKTVTVSGRIDFGKLHTLLVTHPLDDLELTISPRLIDPGDRTPSLLASPPPGLTSATPAVITRTSIMGKFDQSTITPWRTTYARSLSLIMGDMKISDLKVRIRAANQIASLLVLSDGIKSGDLRPPNQLSGRIDRAVLILMAAEMLKNSSDVVRAEMLAALGDVKLEGSIIRSLSSIIKDRSALVRFRLVELLGASGISGQDPILKYFAKDKYDLVSNLAKAMLPPKKDN
jgi:tetratricopeptide (TPR) repeat protein